MSIGNLTTEKFRGICGSRFNLAHYAIELGRYLMKSGHETSLTELLNEVKKHPDPHYLEDLKEADAIEEENTEI